MPVLKIRVQYIAKKKKQGGNGVKPFHQNKTSNLKNKISEININFMLQGKNLINV